MDEPPAIAYHSDMDLTLGFADQWEDFAKRHSSFLANWEDFMRLRHAVFKDSQEVQKAQDRVVYFLGLCCLEDFSELLLLAGNGYGFGALKILRGLYERAVTMAYLSQHEDEVTAFADYHWVQQRKLLIAVKDVYGVNYITSEQSQVVDTHYNEVKDRFLIQACRECGSERLNHTWSKLDFVAMAKQTGELGTLIVDAYYLPLRYAHSTMGSVLSRVEQTPTGSLGFNPDLQIKQADQALRTAHHVLLLMMDTAAAQFGLTTVTTPLQAKCRQAFNMIWAAPVVGCVNTSNHLSCTCPDC